MEAAELSQAPEPAEVRRIAAMHDAVLRNLEITHCYWRLAQAVARRTGVGANWCTFATWASKQAGSTSAARTPRSCCGYASAAVPSSYIRSSRSGVRLLRRGLLDPTSRLGRLVAGAPHALDALERASDAVARGNRKVFEEIGLEFARYLHDCPPEAADIQPFLDSLAAGEPPEGQQFLRQAFGAING